MQRRFRTLVLLVVAVAVAACGVTSDSAPPSSPLVASPDLPSPVTSEATAEPKFSFGPKAVATTGLAGWPGAQLISPGAVIEVDGVMHMYPNVSDDPAGHVILSYLVSKDGGETWVLETGDPLLSSGDEGLTEVGINVSTGYIAEDGTWILIFETNSYKPWILGRATAPGARGPWTIDPEPILTEGPAGAFDDGGVQSPSVVKIGDQLTMFYAGVDDPSYPRWATMIGMAVLEGDRWVKRDEPVLTASEPWELGSVDLPSVVATPTGLVMVYSGLDVQTQRGMATSADGIRWQKEPGRVITPEQFRISGAAGDATLLYLDEQLVYFLEIRNGQAGTGIYRGTLDWP